MQIQKKRKISIGQIVDHIYEMSDYPTYKVVKSETRARLPVGKRVKIPQKSQFYGGGVKK